MPADRERSKVSEGSGERPLVSLQRILHLGVKSIDGLRIEPGSVAEYHRAKAEGRGVLLARRDDGTYEVAGTLSE